MAAFAVAAIITIAVTHVMRGCGARVAELHGVVEKQVSLVLFYHLLIMSIAS